MKPKFTWFDSTRTVMIGLPKSSGKQWESFLLEIEAFLDAF